MRDAAWNAPFLRPALFDRFEANSEAMSKRDLVRHLTDILSGRRAYPALTSGVLGWGLPDVCNMTPSAKRDRDTVASYIEEAITNFEPRLENVQVTPIEGSLDFAFRVDARMVQAKGEWISLRILTPLRGGGLGTQVVQMERGGFNRGDDNAD